MAAIPVVINGIIWDKQQKKGKPVCIMGQATIAGLSIGGGPVIPPDVQPPPDLGFWQDPGGYNPDNPSQPHPPETPPGAPPFEAKVYWTEETGWGVVLVPTGEHVTPSKR